MPSNNISSSKNAGYFVTNLVFRGLITFMLALPYRWRVPAMGWVVSRVLAPLAGWRRRIRDNLAHVLPDISEEDASQISLAVPDNAGRTLIEIYSGDTFKKRAIAAPLSGPGYAASKKE